MTENDISNIFKDSVPDDPETAGWGDTVRRAHRRRRRRSRALTGGAALVIVAAIAVPLGLSIGGTMKQVVATPAATPSHTATTSPMPLEPDVCRGADGSYRAVTSLPDGRLPDGATRVWLCGGPSELFAPEFVGAPEPLSQGVAEAVAAFNAVASESGTVDCSPNSNLTFTTIYDYPDGSQQVVRGSLGCDTLFSLDRHRSDARDYLDTLRRLWNAQRSDLDTSFTANVAVCPALSSVMGVELSGMARGYACGPVDGGVPVQIPLSDDLVKEMVAELSAQDFNGGPEPGITWEAPSLVFLSKAGDPYTILGTPDGYYWYDPEPGGMNQWRPSAQLAARIWEEMLRDGFCTAPDRLLPSEVRVDVYDGGGGSASVQRVVDHLAAAGFDVTNTHETATPSLGGPIILRGGPESNGGGMLVASQFMSVGGEVSQSEDAVVDVVVTSVFNDEDAPFAREPLTDVPNGELKCRE